MIMGSSVSFGITTTHFTSGIHLSTSDVNDLVKTVRAEANQIAGKDPTTAKILDQLAAALTNALGHTGQSKHSCGGGGKNWLEAIAEAMGQALGQLAQKLVDESTSLQSLAGNSSGSGAQEFQATMAKFQADSQIFGMLSNAFSNAIKSIGEGMSTMANKQ
jgi:uncharacterized protein YukE